MKPGDARGAAAELTGLYEEAARLTEQFCAQVRRGEDDGGAAFGRERSDIFTAIQSFWGGAEGPGVSDPEAVERQRADSARAIRRILELDRELVGLLEARKAGLRSEIEGIQSGRRSLGSYRGPVAVSPAFVDRIG